MEAFHSLPFTSFSFRLASICSYSLPFTPFRSFESLPKLFQNSSFRHTTLRPFTSFWRFSPWCTLPFTFLIKLSQTLRTVSSNFLRWILRICPILEYCKRLMNSTWKPCRCSQYELRISTIRMLENLKLRLLKHITTSNCWTCKR